MVRVSARPPTGRVLDRVELPCLARAPATAGALFLASGFAAAPRRVGYAACNVRVGAWACPARHSTEVVATVAPWWGPAVQQLKYVRGPFVNNVYVLVGDENAAVVVDPGLECDDVIEDLARRGLRI